MKGPNPKLGAILTGVCAVLFYGATAPRLVLNGTDSLPHTGYFMLAYPKVLWTGAYVAVTPPEALADQFHPDAKFVKRLVGQGGDRVASSGAEVCIETTFRALDPNLDAQVFRPLASGPIPEGQIAIFGDSADSLDSRYALIGLFDRQEVAAVGWPINIPHWTRLARWFGRDVAQEEAGA